MSANQNLPQPGEKFGEGVHFGTVRRAYLDGPDGSILVVELTDGRRALRDASDVTADAIDARVRATMRTKFENEDDWHAYEESRGALAGTPEFLPCYTCTRSAGRNPMDDSQLIEHAVVRLGGVVEQRRDPTQTYVLSCGHTTI